VEADVASGGVRIAVWAQVAVLLIISVLGNFHSKATGAKEIEIGLVLTHISLAIAILVQANHGTLTLADAVIGSMVLDAQNMALSIQLAAKETLAARWQVTIVVLSQAFGLIVVAFVISKVDDGSLITNDCRCLKVFWWAFISNCPSVSSEWAIFWIYFICGCIDFCQSSFHSLYNTRSFHLAEPKKDGLTSDDRQNGKAFVSITYPYGTSSQATLFGEYPAAVTFMYTLYGLYALTSLTAAETTMRELDLSPTSAIDSVGQIIALVIASATILRAVWLFGSLFVHEKENKALGFIWPFELQRFSFRYRSAATYLLVPSFDYPPSFLPLGSILVSPKQLLKLTNNISPSGQVQEFSRQNFHFVWSNNALSLRKPLSIMRVEALDTRFFYPDDEYMKTCVQLPEVAAYMREKKRRTVYLVTGIKIARGLKDDETSVNLWGIVVSS